MVAESAAPLWISTGSLMISGVALGWNIYRDAIDRGKLRVSCYISQARQLGRGVVADNLLVWAVTNVGRKPVMLHHIGGQRGKKHEDWIVTAPRGGQLPKMLRPGDYYMGCQDNLQGIGPDLRSLWAYDTLGRRYYASKKQVRAVIMGVAQKRAAGELEEQVR